MLKGLMMERPLLISDIIDYAAEVRRDGEVVTVLPEGGDHRYTYADAAKRVARLAHGLRAAGIEPGDRIATIAWNTHRHFELYYAISGIGAVCHTINPRLPAEQLVYVLKHAGDRMLFVDVTFVPLVEALSPHLPDELRVVVMTDRTHMPSDAKRDYGCYEEMLDGQPETIDWPEFDENTASALCYTSGTTGHPKGALYSHRSTILHALFVMSGEQEAFREGNRILPVVPLFHVNAWGLPYLAALNGASLIMPGPKLDGESLFDLMDREKVTSAWGVPTVWFGLLQEMKKRGRKPEGFAQVLIGGSAAPGPMIDSFEKDYGVSVVHGWGMTEMSPVGTLGSLSPSIRTKPRDEQLAVKRKQGRRMFGVELKIVDDDGRSLPKDGEATGELMVRGNGIISGYFGNEEASKSAFDTEGWFRTGDVASISPDGYLAIVDRSKDLIKSGGEWISSIDLENAAMAHPGVALAAVIAIPHPKWDERPLLIVVRAPETQVTREEILSFLEDKVAKWQVPDDVAFVDEVPLTATGKVSKLKLREQFADYQLPDSEAAE